MREQRAGHSPAPLPQVLGVAGTFGFGGGWDFWVSGSLRPEEEEMSQLLLK